MVKAATSHPRLHWSERLVPGSLMLAMFVFAIYPLKDTDFWWHLRTGQLITQLGRVPRTDWYLFTDSNRPWIDLHWGFQVAIAGLYWLGGINLIIIVKAIILATVAGVCWSVAGTGLAAWQRLLCWFPAALCIACRGGERPEIVSLLFLAVWLWTAFRAEQETRWMWWWPVLQLLWINFHSLFILGFIVEGCFILDIVLRRLAHSRWGLNPVASTFPMRRMWIIAVLSVIAALCNPYFTQGLLFPWTLYQKFSSEQEFYSARIMEFVQPWRVLTRVGLSNLYLIAEVWLALAATLSMVTVTLATRRWSPFRWLLFAGFLHLGWEAVRNINLFGLVMGILLTANVADLVTWWKTRQIVARAVRSRSKTAVGNSSIIANPDELLTSRATLVANLVVSLLICGRVLLSVTGVMGNLSPDRGAFRLGEEPWWFGHEAMKFAGQEGFPKRAILSHIGLAATYEFHNAPDRKVFLDPRLEVASQETFLAQDWIMEQIQKGDRRWEQLVRDDRGDLPAVILDTRISRFTIEDMLRTPGWRLVHADLAAAVFLTQKQADELKLPTADPTRLWSNAP